MAILSILPPNLQAEQRTCFSIQFDAPAPLRLWHLTSLDAPTVAVTWTLAFAWAAHLRMPAWIVMVVALAAWCLYIADRLLDARNASTPLRARHHFHWKHRRIFLPVAFAAAIVAIALVLHSMPFAARERNSVIAAAALAYFTSVHSPWRVTAVKPWLRFPKELLVGVLFTLACAAPTLTRLTGHRTGFSAVAVLPTILVFIVLAWLNCHAIESWEAHPKRQSVVLRPATALIVAALPAAAIAAVGRDPRDAALLATAALSAALLALLERRRHSLTPIALRACADLALLTPLALLLLPGWLVP